MADFAFLLNDSVEDCNAYFFRWLGDPRSTVLVVWDKKKPTHIECRKSGDWIMKICIRRGAKQIGGTCIEIESQGKRLVLDIGQPLDSPDAESVEMPAWKGLKTSDDSAIGRAVVTPAYRPLWTGIPGSAFYTLPHGSALSGFWSVRDIHPIRGDV